MPKNPTQKIENMPSPSQESQKNSTNNEAKVSVKTQEASPSSTSKKMKSKVEKASTKSPVDEEVHNRKLNEAESVILNKIDESFKHFGNIAPIPHSKTLKVSKNPANIPAHHRHAYLGHFDEPEFFNKLTLQALFFIFYTYGGTKAQHYAAQVLKKRDWRFHTQLNTWCQRSSEPHVIGPDSEQGPYVTFDYENWVQKSENNFKFEYRFMEDKIDRIT